jgi:hypothetical protein
LGGGGWRAEEPQAAGEESADESDAGEPVEDSLLKYGSTSVVGASEGRSDTQVVLSTGLDKHLCYSEIFSQRQKKAQPDLLRS